MEVELKLLIASQDTQAFKKHALIRKYAQGRAVDQEQIAIYFDTGDGDFRRSDAGLRVRKVGNVWTQTLKAGGSVASGLHRRNEWESVVPGPEPDLYALRKLIDVRGPWDALIASPRIAAKLHPIFTTRIHRTIWELRLPGGDAIECVLDQGTVEHRDQRESVSEIELELKSGDPVHLFDFALELLKDIPMRLGNASKAERGYALYTQKKPAAVKAEKLTLSKKMTVEQAFEAIIGNCLHHIQANDAAVMQTGDIEGLHQMRVGLRRLRSALGLFSEVIDLPEALQQEIDWLSDQISAARDWDVLATSTLEAVDVDDGTADLDALKKAAFDKAAAMHKVATAAIDSVRYTALLLSLARWLQGREWRETPPPLKGKGLKKRLKAFSGDMLEHDQRRLSKRGRQLPEADAHARHRVRIAAKKMRYDTEFFQSLYSSKETDAYVSALSKLQDKLGWLNDVAVGEGLLIELQADQSELAGVTGYIRGYLAARAVEDEKKVAKLWKKFKSKNLPK